MFIPRGRELIFIGQGKVWVVNLEGGVVYGYKRSSQFEERIQCTLAAKIQATPMLILMIMLMIGVLLFSVPDCLAHFVRPASFWRFSGLSTWLAKLMLICVKTSDGVIMAIILLSELLHDADIKLFRSMLHSTHSIIHQLLPHWSLCQWNSALLIALLLFPTSIITSTNMYLFYDV